MRLYFSDQVQIIAIIHYLTANGLNGFVREFAYMRLFLGWRLDISRRLQGFVIEEAAISLLRHFHPSSCYRLLALPGRESDRAGGDADRAGPGLFDASD